MENKINIFYSVSVLVYKWHSIVKPLMIATSNGLYTCVHVHATYYCYMYDGPLRGCNNLSPSPDLTKVSVNIPNCRATTPAS